MNTKSTKLEARNTKQYQITKIQMFKTGFRILRIRILNLFRISDLGFRICPNKNGIALIIVVSIMAVLASIAAAFSYSMIMDQRAAANYMTGIKADYIAKAGIQHAIGVLKKDGDPSNRAGLYAYEGYDWYGDDWGYDSSLFGAYGADADSCVSNDDDVVSISAAAAGADSRWIYLKDSQGHLIGRYAVLVLDESGKVNINTAGTSFGNEGWTTAEINLANLCHLVLGESAASDTVLSARYGDECSPGVHSEDDNHDSIVLSNDGIDNDGDNLIDSYDLDGEGTDDSAEFYIANPYTTSSGNSADTPFVTIGEVVSRAGMSGGNYGNLSPYITAWSSDKNLTDSGIARLNINAVSSAMELYSTLRDACEYWEPPATTYSTTELAQMAVNIIDFSDRDNGSTRIDVEDNTGKIFTRYGVEGIRINEVMVRPVFRKEASQTAGDGNIIAGGSWGWSAPHWEDAAAGGDTSVWEWTTANIPAGTYKLKVYGTGGDDIRAKTSVNGGTIWLPDDDELGDWYGDGSLSDYIDCDTVIIGGSGVQIKIQNVNNSDTAYFDSAVFSQSPDCEYVEIVNISPNSIDVGGWHLEFPNGQVGTIPGGKNIASGDTVVLAIDKDDTYNNDGVYNNEISLEKAVVDGIFNTSLDTTKIWQLSFTNTILEDIISDTVLVDSPLRLYDGPIAPTSGNPAGHIVDQVLWDSLIIQDNDFYSMERNDPTYLGTDVLNDSGIFDTWLICADATYRGTPTEANLPNKTTGSVNVKNSPFANIGEVADVSLSYEEWTNIGGAAVRIKNIADRITVSGRRLDAEFATYTPGASVDWYTSEAMSDEEIKRKFGKEHGSGADKFTGDLYWFKAKPNKDEDDEDTWTWYTTIDRFEADTYIMYVYGREGGTMRVRVGNDTALIIPSSDYGARFGRVVIEDTTLEVAVSPEDSDSDSTYFDYILLTPASKTYGRININTAGSTVLQALKGVDSTLANAIVNDTPFQTIGHLVTAPTATITTTTFQPISNLITTKSNVFKIICTGQSILDKDGDGTFDVGSDEVLGERKITVIYER